MSKNSDILKLIEQIKEETGEELTVASNDSLKLERISFGIVDLDKILGGGFVRGRTHILKGGFSSGKSFLSFNIIKQVQQSGGIAALVDMERGLDPSWAKAVGVDIDTLIVSTPPFGEKALDVVVALIKGNVDVVVLDSIAALIPTAEEEGGMEQYFMAPLARMMNKGLRKITVANKHSVFIGINQEREGLGGQVHVNVLPAGKGQEVFASIILDVGRGDWIKAADGVTRLGFNMKCFTTKNKVAAPQQECVLPFIFGQGIDEILGIFSAAVDAGKIERQKNTFLFDGAKIGNRTTVLDKLRADKEFLEKIKGLL